MTTSTVSPNMFHPSNGVRCFYLRDRHGNPTGLIMTNVSEAQNKMGWSLCNRRQDVFYKFEAKMVAMERMADVPSVELDGVRDTPMNRALTALSQNEAIPHTVSSGARRELQRRRMLEEYSKNVSVSTF